jgi:hypothetical protein
MLRYQLASTICADRRGNIGADYRDQFSTLVFSWGGLTFFIRIRFDDVAAM